MIKELYRADYQPHSECLICPIVILHLVDLWHWELGWVQTVRIWRYVSSGAEPVPFPIDWPIRAIIHFIQWHSRASWGEMIGGVGGVAATHAAIISAAVRPDKRPIKLIFANFPPPHSPFDCANCHRNWLWLFNSTLELNWNWMKFIGWVDRWLTGSLEWFDWFKVKFSFFLGGGGEGGGGERERKKESWLTLTADGARRCGSAGDAGGRRSGDGSATGLFIRWRRSSWSSSARRW